MATRPKPETWFTVAEVAEAWRVSLNYVYDLIAKNEIRSTDLGHGRAKTRIPASAIAEFEAKRTREDRKARRLEVA